LHDPGTLIAEYNTKRRFDMWRSLIAAVILLVSHTADAQKLFDVGFKAGINQDDIRILNVADHKPVLGWHAGMFTRVKAPLSPGLQVELLYSTQGTDLRISDSIPGETQIRLNYLQLPVFLVFSLGPAELHVGGYGSYLMNASITQPVTAYDEVMQLRENLFNDMDYGLLGGVGVKLGSFYAGGRYLLGLGTVGEGVALLRDSRNLQAQIYIGIGLVQ
jgi:hypothetical protein